MKHLMKMAVVLSVVVAAGCASNTQQLDEIRAIAEGAQRSASQANDAAAAAQRTANQALSAANAAQASADRANEKVDRAFKKAMEK